MENAPFNKDWIADGQILRYRFSDTGKRAADLWFEDLAQVFREWDESKSLHLLIDVRGQDSVVSAQALIRARQVSHVRPNILGRTAVLVGRGLAVQVLAGIVRSGLAKGKRERQIFNQEEDAINWLLKDQPTYRETG